MKMPHTFFIKFRLNQKKRKWALRKSFLENIKPDMFVAFREQRNNWEDEWNQPPQASSSDSVSDKDVPKWEVMC